MAREPGPRGVIDVRAATRRAGLAAIAAATPRRVTDALWGRDRLTVLAYHRIAAPGGDVYDPGVVSATPEMFERQMRHLAREFSVISLADLQEHVTGGRPLPDRPALITFDDGYRDNYDAAFPVLRAMGLPAVVFLITGAIGTDRVMWWDELSHLLRETRRTHVDLPLAGPRALVGDGALAAVRTELLGLLKAVPDQARATAMTELAQALEVAPARPASPLFMGWTEVEEMAAHGVDFQPHTVDHPLMIRVDPERARSEISRSAAEVAARTHRPIRAFAYPNGDYDASTLDALREAGIPLAFTMRLGPCTPRTARDAPLEIPRVPLEARDTWDLFRLKVSGALSSVFRVRRWRPGRPGGGGA